MRVDVSESFFQRKDQKKNQKKTSKKSSSPYVARRVHQEVLRLDVPVAHARRVVQVRERPARLVDGQLDEQRRHALPALCVMLRDSVAVAQADDVRVPHHLHHGELAVLEPAVLEDLFDRDRLARLEAGRLEDDAEGAVADDAGRREGEGRAGRRGGSGSGRGRGPRGRGGRRRRRGRRGGGAVARASTSSSEAPEGGDGGGADDVGARGRVPLDDAALVGLLVVEGGFVVFFGVCGEEVEKREKKVCVFLCPGGRFFLSWGLMPSISLSPFLSSSIPQKIRTSSFPSAPRASSRRRRSLRLCKSFGEYASVCVRRERR